MSKRILVCGGRDFTDHAAIERALLDYGGQNILIHGNARGGADRIAAAFALRHNWWIWACPADWDTEYKSAGPIRNQRMLDECAPDVVLAFPSAQSKGTWDMVRRARKAGIETHVHKESELTP